MTERGTPDLTDTYGYRYAVYQIYDIGTMKSRIIGSVKFTLIPSSNVSETKATVQDVPQANIFQLKVLHSTVSPEELSERWQIGLKQARYTITKTTQRLTSSAIMTLVMRCKADRVFQTKSLKSVCSIDTIYIQINSLDGNQYAQVFSNGT